MKTTEQLKADAIAALVAHVSAINEQIEALEAVRNECRIRIGKLAAMKEVVLMDPYQEHGWSPPFKPYPRLSDLQ
jgi:hypothetical protein